MKRLCAAFFALLLFVPAFAAEPEEQVYTQEETKIFVEALFAAAVGVDYEQEAGLRAEMTEEQILERNAENALYRQQTRPWLMEAFGYEPEELPESDELSESVDPVWTSADSFACFSENEYGVEYLSLLSTYGAEGAEACMTLTREICSAWLAEVDHAKLSEMNDDYALWLYAPKTQIDYPVVLGSDNKYYLKRLFNGEKNSAGTLFIDYRNLPDLQDPNTLIYGHHMRNDSMFGTLTDYEEQAYFEAHPYLLATNGKEIYLLEVIAGYTTTKNDHCYDIAISDENDMMNFLNTAAEKSDFQAGVDVELSDRLVTLSTCAYAFENARYILIARAVPVTLCMQEIAEETDTTNN